MHLHNFVISPHDTTCSCPFTRAYRHAQTYYCLFGDCCLLSGALQTRCRLPFVVCHFTFAYSFFMHNCLLKCVHVCECCPSLIRCALFVLLLLLLLLLFLFLQSLYAPQMHQVRCELSKLQLRDIFFGSAHNNNNENNNNTNSV